MHQAQPQWQQPAQPLPPAMTTPKRRRVFFWLFTGLQAVTLIVTVASAGSGPGPGCTGECAAATQTAQGQNLLDGLETWAALDVIAFTIWAAWKLDR